MLSHLISINILHYDHTVLSRFLLLFCVPLELICTNTNVQMGFDRGICVALTRLVLLCDKKPNPHLHMLLMDRCVVVVPSRQHL